MLSSNVDEMRFKDGKIRHDDIERIPKYQVSLNWTKLEKKEKNLKLHFDSHRPPSSQLIINLTGDDSIPCHIVDRQPQVMHNFHKLDSTRNAIINTTTKTIHEFNFNFFFACPSFYFIFSIFFSDDDFCIH